jgi:hypothetical protein
LIFKRNPKTKLHRYKKLHILGDKLDKIFVAANNIRTEIGITRYIKIRKYFDKVRESRINASREEHRKILLLNITETTFPQLHIDYHSNLSRRYCSSSRGQ